jgi:uronate dehydrogenase
VRVVVAGAAGSIGKEAVAGLVARGHSVVALDQVECAPGPGVEVVVGDVLDPEVARPAIAGAGAVVHLAGVPSETSLPDALASHVLTTAVLLDAMVDAGVPRFVYASSNHAVGSTPRAGLLTTDVRVRPDTFYGVAKVAAEGLCSMYADQHGLDTVACRIGSFTARPATRRQLSTWLSPDDGARMIAAAVTTDVRGFSVLYGISANTRAWWDLEPGRALGYHPEDDAERYAAEVEATDSTVDDALEADVVGGPWALHRPEPA